MNQRNRLWTRLYRRLLQTNVHAVKQTNSSELITSHPDNMLTQRNSRNVGLIVLGLALVLATAVALALLKPPQRHSDRALSKRLLESVINGNYARTLQLLDQGASPNSADSDGHTALMYAANGDVRILRLLLSRGAAVNHRDKWGRTALYMVKRISVEQEKLLTSAGGVY